MPIDRGALSALSILGRTFGKNDVTAVVLSHGEPTTQDAIASVNQQSLPVDEVIVVRDVAPFHKALNAGASRVKTSYFVQVDADMILDRHCVDALRKSMRPHIGIVVGRLRDALIGQTVGVKLFRTACFKDTSFEDTISSDTDFVDDIARAGWDTIYIGRLINSWATFGEHRPDYTPAYTYRKHLLQGARYRYLQKPEGFRWHFRVLDRSAHPSALIAQTALAQGLFLRETRDLLGIATYDSDFARIGDFISSNQNGSAPDDPSLRPDVSMEELFGTYYRFGNALIAAGASLTFKHHMQALNNAASDQIALLSRIGLCRGLSARNGDISDAKITLDYRAVDRFLFRPDLPIHEGDDGSDHSHESSDLEAIAGYAFSAKLRRFAIDGPRAAEYQTDYSAKPPALRNTGRRITSTLDGKGRSRIKLPFSPFGQIICTQEERLNGIFWCLDLLKAGYAFAHLPSFIGPRKVSVPCQLARNCLVRAGWLNLVSSPPSVRSTLRTLTRNRNPDYRPIPRRILMVISTFTCGGSELQMLAMAAALMKRGYDVRIMALWPLQQDEPNIVHDIVETGLQPRLWSDFTASVAQSQWSRRRGTPASGLPLWFVKKAQAVELAIRQDRPSVVHGWLDLPAMIATVAGCTLGVPQMVVSQRSTHQHIRTYGAETASFVWEAYRAVTRNPAVAILNNSAAAATGYERWLHLRADTIKVLPNCYLPERVRVPTAAETAEFRAKLGIPRDAPVVGTIMRLVVDKDPRLWVDTAARIALARPDVRFIIAGSGILQEAIENQIKTLGIADRFTLLGAVSDVGLVYSALDVVLLTSIAEGLPNVLIEAQAARRPVVTTAVGGAKEAVLVGQTGLVVEQRSPTQLARAVLRILVDPAWRERVRVAGPQFVGEHFDGDRIVSRLVEIYGGSSRAI
jgi:glycosyltransferase involved in cell wall biosynthesis